MGQPGQVDGWIPRDKERQPLRAYLQLHADAGSIAAVCDGGPGGQVGARVQARPELRSFGVTDSLPGRVDDGGRSRADLQCPILLGAVEGSANRPERVKGLQAAIHIANHAVDKTVQHIAGRDGIGRDGTQFTRMGICAQRGHELLRPLHAREQIVPMQRRSSSCDAIVGSGVPLSQHEALATSL